MRKIFLESKNIDCSSHYFQFLLTCYNRINRIKNNKIFMITELNIYISLLVAALLFTFATRLGISLYQSN